MKIKHKNVLVYGMSESGKWVSKLLIKKKANVHLYDDNKDILKAQIINGCYVLNILNENLISQFDYIVVSPAIPYDNEILKIARQLKIKIFSEVEFASFFCKDYVSVTGTNGKTTTVQIITALLQAKHKAIACGNIGFPLSRAVLESKKSVKVVEVSSFMLENAETFSPHVATITNIEADHLIRHKTMEEYSRLKKSIFKNLAQQDVAVVNVDLSISPPNNCVVLTYSLKQPADVFVKKGAIYLHNEKIINLNELPIKGNHNIYNVMCAICFAYVYKIKPKQIRNVLLNLRAEKFRIEHIATVNQIKFVNDSKSTNIASTLAATQSVPGAIILLLGGSDKGLDYKKLFEKMTRRVKQIVVYGEIANKLICDNNNKFNVIRFKTLKQAFDYAVSKAKEMDTILLSPATASYDQYKNYIERGNDFNRMVKEYENSTKKT